MSTACARSGLKDTWLTSMSKALSPGAIELSNGTTVQMTSSFAKPSFSASAYAKALSKPLPSVGSPSSQGFVAPASGMSKYGGYAGLSVPIVSFPDAFVVRASFAQASADALGSTLAAADALAAVDGASDGAALLGDGDAPPVHALRARLASRMVVIESARRMSRPRERSKRARSVADRGRSAGWSHRSRGLAVGNPMTVAAIAGCSFPALQGLYRSSRLRSGPPRSRHVHSAGSRATSRVRAALEARKALE